jgi:hypothetical protein
MPELDSLHIAARRVLLDALTALHQHADAIVLIGAQAVYHHTGNIELAVAPYTKDADVALDPATLGEDPEIVKTMRDAHFVLGVNGNPGEFVITTQLETTTVEIPVDILVPESMASGSGRRSAGLRGHDRGAARRAVGIEAAIVDNDWVELSSFETSDHRIIPCRVAGPSALLIAKAHKIAERLGPRIRPERQMDKDALDVFRIALAVPMSLMGPVFRSLLADPRSADTTRTGITLIVKHFGSRRSIGTTMATRALEGSLPSSRVEDVFADLTTQLALLPI